jgi:hypothetical protein
VDVIAAEAGERRGGAGAQRVDAFDVDDVDGVDGVDGVDDGGDEACEDGGLVAGAGADLKHMVGGSRSSAVVMIATINGCEIVCS